MAAHILIDNTKNKENTSTCDNCGNVYQVVLVNPSYDFDNYGLWFCPVCGLLIEEFE